MVQFSARPIRIVDSIAFSLAVGSEPGSARHTGQTCVFGGAPKVVGQPQNIFEAVPSSTCVSSPSTGSKRSSASSYGMSVAVSAMLVTQSFQCFDHVIPPLLEGGHLPQFSDAGVLRYREIEVSERAFLLRVQPRL